MCSYRSKCKGNFKRHFETQHATDKPAPELCPVCDKKYANRSALNKHIRKKHNLSNIESER